MEHKTEIYEMCRGEGKTYKMLKMSEELGIPILCGIQSMLNILKNKAKENNINIVEPILYNGINCHVNGKVLIDEIGILFSCICNYTNTKPRVQCTDDIIYFIEKTLNCKIYACTYTPIRLEMKQMEENEN